MGPDRRIDFAPLIPVDRRSRTCKPWQFADPVVPPLSSRKEFPPQSIQDEEPGGPIESLLSVSGEFSGGDGGEIGGLSVFVAQDVRSGIRACAGDCRGGSGRPFSR